jgi:hypothetical protein
MEGIMRELTIEELMERWQWLLWECCAELRITEKFPQRGIHSFVVNGLTMETEKDFVICSDVDDILIKNLSILSIFIRSQLVNILLLPIDEGLYQERLEFRDRVVLIEIV